MHETDKADQISDLQWDYRIVLGVVENPEQLRHSVEILENKKEELAERKIVYFITDGQQQQSNYPDKLGKNFWKDVERIVNESNEAFALIGLMEA